MPNTDVNGFIDNNGSLKGDDLRKQIENKNLLPEKGSTYLLTSNGTVEHKLGKNGELFSEEYDYAKYFGGNDGFPNVEVRYSKDTTEVDRHFFDNSEKAVINVLDVLNSGWPEYPFGSSAGNSMSTYFFYAQAVTSGPTKRYQIPFPIMTFFNKDILETSYLFYVVGYGVRLTDDSFTTGGDPKVIEEQKMFRIGLSSTGIQSFQFYDDSASRWRDIFDWTLSSCTITIMKIK